MEVRKCSDSMNFMTKFCVTEQKGTTRNVEYHGTKHEDQNCSTNCA
jgi:hypothetical protein